MVWLNLFSVFHFIPMYGYHTALLNESVIYIIPVPNLKHVK